MRVFPVPTTEQYLGFWCALYVISVRETDGKQFVVLRVVRILGWLFEGARGFDVKYECPYITKVSPRYSNRTCQLESP